MALQHKEFAKKIPSAREEYDVFSGVEKNVEPCCDLKTGPNGGVGPARTPMAAVGKR